MDIDIYDFDKTIVPFDSGSLFCGYCLLHYPYLILLLPIGIPILAVAAILMLAKLISFTDFKKICFIFVPLIPLDKAVKGFWDKHEKEVHKWFYQRKRYTVVISASPDFLLNDISERLGFDKDEINVIDVYSDSLRHDRPIFSLGKNCYQIVDGKIVPFEYNKVYVD